MKKDTKLYNTLFSIVKLYIYVENTKLVEIVLEQRRTMDNIFLFFKLRDGIILIF